MTFLRKLALPVLTTLLLAAPAISQERAIIVFDGSGSMWAQIDGVARITIARETLKEVLAELPPDLELGFMTYGHRSKGDCADIEMLVEPGPDNAEAISEAADGIVPKGKTPISDAVRLAAEDLNYTEDEATVILITDGIETCEVDPCALADELESKGINFTTHVIGFGLSEEEGLEVSCLAENTGGMYLQASDASELATAMTKMTDEVMETTETTVVAETEEEEPEAPVEPEQPDYNIDPEVVLVEGGDPLTESSNVVWEFFKVLSDGSKGEYYTTEYYGNWKGTLEPGDYIMHVYLDRASVDMPVTIVEGEVAEPYVVLNAGMLIIHPKATEDGEVDTDASVELKFTGGEGGTTYYGDTKAFVPAGDIEVIVGIGEGELAEVVEVAAGTTVEQDFVVGVGRALLNAYYVEDQKVDAGALAVEVVGAKKAIDGTRKSVSYGYGPDNGFDLPPGDYVAILTMEQSSVEVPFTVETGELTEVSGILNAGVLVVTAENAYGYEIFSTKKDIQGNRKQFGYSYDPTFQVTLPEGEYEVVATIGQSGGEQKVATVTVTAGERNEVTIE